MKKTFIPAFNYDFLTPYYDFILNIIGFGSAQRLRIVNLLKLKSKEKLLDVGCGTGSLLLAIKKKHPKINSTGIDPDIHALNIAKKKLDKYSDVKLILSGAEKLPFKASSFDVIVSSLVFHHLPLKIKRGALKEIYRVLKPKGTFLLIDFGKVNWPLKLIYHLIVLLHIPERETLKDNVEGKIPNLLKAVGFNYKEIAPPYRGIRYIEARKE